MRLAAILLVSSAVVWADGISQAEYKTRRLELRKSLDGVMVLFGASEPDDLHNAFFQESNFLYLSGWREPGAVMMLTRREEILFLPPRNAQEENFTGRKTLAEDGDAVDKTGFEKVLPRAAIESNFLRLMESAHRVYSISSDLLAQKLMNFAVFHERAEAGPEIARLRVIKSPAEIALLQKSAEATIPAHLAAWKKIKPGVYEYEIAAAMTNVYFDRGCERSAYAPIVGSGPNSVILHYMANRRRVDRGEVVLMDVGAECSDYATDVTRTVPAGGKFSARQREIYDIVLGAQKAAIAAAKPGAHLRGGKDSLQQIAYDYINSHGKDLHGDSLGKYFTHGLGHFVGLDVHDPGDSNQPLEAGMVITIEPGIYIPEENIGVRIEDTLLVTEDGAKNLSGALPREAAEIEKLVGK
ncbi:MAG TPA: aminopeptidase P N-terminal domain-containing protein [Bryobacteraceae bacterium]|nr:aminopeptidase P N-terminal domain-containing protein [Bryobacteraceae bacterium]